MPLTQTQRFERIAAIKHGHAPHDPNASVQVLDSVETPSGGHVVVYTLRRALLDDGTTYAAHFSKDGKLLNSIIAP